MLNVDIDSLTPHCPKHQNPVVRRTPLIPLAGALTAALLGMAGCVGSDASSGAGTATVAANARFGGTDLAWIEINIAMDEQLLPLLELAPKQTGDAAMQALALQVKAVTDAELGTLHALHDAAGLPAQNQYKGTPLPGMVTPDQVTQAATLNGAKFNALLVRQIKAHLEQSQNLAQSEQKSGVESQTRALALNVIRTRAEVRASIDD